MNNLVATIMAAVAGKATCPLAPGQYNVDETLTVRVCGTVVKGEDETYTPTVAVPLKAVLALLLARMGATREAAMDAMVSAMADALNGGEGAVEGMADRTKDVDTAMARVNDMLAALPEKTRSGKTRVDATMVIASPTMVEA